MNFRKTISQVTQRTGICGPNVFSSLNDATARMAQFINVKNQISSHPTENTCTLYTVQVVICRHICICYEIKCKGFDNLSMNFYFCVSQDTVYQN